MFTKCGNNGNQLAELMHHLAFMHDDMTLEQLDEIARTEGIMLNNRHLDNDDFWGDFLYRADELGYKLKY